jgi:hypothetical protein
MPDDDERFAALAAPPRPPSDPDLFSSNTLFGEPGIYPQGSEMVPARGGPVTEQGAIASLAFLRIEDLSTRLADDTLTARAPDVGVRAGLLALTGTVGGPLLAAFLDGRTRVDAVRYGEPSSPGRIVGPAANAAGAAERVVNERYVAEHPALLAGSLAHDLLWNPDGAGQFEEATLHALCAMVHVQLIAKEPALARTGTELARRQNSLAITLLNSRHPGSADIALIAPDGLGTIPGALLAEQRARGGKPGDGRSHRGAHMQQRDTGGQPGVLLVQRLHHHHREGGKRGHAAQETDQQQRTQHRVQINPGAQQPEQCARRAAAQHIGRQRAQRQRRE